MKRSLGDGQQRDEENHSAVEEYQEMRLIGKAGAVEPFSLLVETLGGRLQALVACGSRRNRNRIWEQPQHYAWLITQIMQMLKKSRNEGTLF